MSDMCSSFACPLWMINSPRALCTLSIIFNYKQICIYANFQIKLTNYTSVQCEQTRQWVLFPLSDTSKRKNSNALQDWRSIHAATTRRCCVCVCVSVRLCARRREWECNGRELACVCVWESMVVSWLQVQLRVVWREAKREQTSARRRECQVQYINIPFAAVKHITADKLVGCRSQQSKAQPSNKDNVQKQRTEAIELLAACSSLHS